MTKAFLSVLELGISASILICVILLIRQISKKKASHRNICVLWLLVGIRLLVPFSLESSFGLVPELSLEETFGVTESKGEITSEENISTDNSESVSTDVIDTTSDDDTSNNIIGTVSDDNTSNGIIGTASDDDTSNNIIGTVSDDNTSNGIIGTVSNDNTSNGTVSKITEVTSGVSSESSQNKEVKTSVLDVLSIVWLSVTVLFLSYGAFGYLKLKKKVSVFTEDENGVRRCEDIDSSFVFGIIRPKIYMPVNLSSETEKHIIAHEKVHIKRLDHISKLLAFVALSVYWFCPLVWVWFILLCRDIEYACDERVIESYSNIERKQYAYAILECSVRKPIFSAYPVSFGATSVKERVKNTMSYKKPTFWIIIVFVILAIVLGALFLTNNDNPKSTENTSTDESANASMDESANTSENTSADESENNSTDESANSSEAQSADEPNTSTDESASTSENTSTDESEEDSSNSSTENGDNTPTEEKATKGVYGDITWELENGILTLNGNGKIKDSTNETAPWLYHKDKITEITMSDSIKHIGADTFKGLTNLKKIKFSNNITGIGYNAFKGCSSLETLDLPSKLTVIYSFAFEGCTSLKKVHLPEKISQFGAEIFLNCKNISEITVDSKHEYLVSIDGVVYTKTKSHLLMYPSAKKNTSYEIENGTNYISSYAFYDCDFLESVVLPKYVNQIQEGAFGSCNNLKKVTISENVTEIEKDAFANSPVSEIYFSQNRKQWLLVKKGENWHNGNSYTVYCNDGNLSHSNKNKPLNMWLPCNGGMDYQLFIYEFDGTINDLVSTLAEFGAVPKGVKVLSFKIEGDIAKIDLSKEFVENMGGSTEESNIIEALVNTIIDNFDVEKVFFTVEGEIFSGHGLYDSPIGFTRYIKLYVPNEDFSGIETIETYCDGSMEDIISLLVEYNALPKGTTVLSYSFDGMYVYVDLSSKEFGDIYFANPEGKGKLLLSCVRGTLQHFYSPKDVIIEIDGKSLDYFVNA